MRIGRSTLAARPTRFAHAAAGRGRAGLGARAERMRGELWPIVQTALAAAVAWLIATTALSGQPIFAPITAMVALGVTLGQRGRRAIEYVLGVSVGVAIADVVVHVIGNGAWQMLVVVVAAMAAASLLSGGTIFVVQAGVSGVLVVALQPTASSSYALSRFLQALIGGGVALLFSQLLFPLDPTATARRAAADLARDLGAALRELASGLADHDLGRTGAARGRFNDLGRRLLDFREVLAAAEAAARFAPRRRRHRGRVGRYRRAAALFDLAVYDAGALALAATRLVRGEQRAPSELAQAVERLADAACGLAALYEQGGAAGAAVAPREHALAAARLATRALAEERGFTRSAVVSQARSLAVDLLRASGMDPDEARASLPPAAAPTAARPLEPVTSANPS